MAIGIFKSLEFGGVNSADYGVFITGEAVYNAPERSVELVSVPGRNGAVLIDNGHFENIEVTYPAGIPGGDRGEFAEKLSNFRNAILSQKGYQRLTDEYNPNEYRLALYVSGMEVDVVEGQQGTVGEFELKFNCKPQRFLKSGEEAVSVSNGEELHNPTCFESEPLLEVEGYGKISFNGFSIDLQNALMGEVEVANNEGMSETGHDTSTYSSTHESQSIPVDAYSNDGDSFTASVSTKMTFNGVFSAKSVSNATISTAPTNGSASVSFSGTKVYINLRQLTLSGNIGEDTQTTVTTAATVTYQNRLDATMTATVNVSVLVRYDSATQKIVVIDTQTGNHAAFTYTGGASTTLNSFAIDSTIPILGHPTYVDCELGECFKVEDGTVISLNSYIDLGSNLPKLAPGDNSVTFDDTVTSLKISPRWWLI